MLPLRGGFQDRTGGREKTVSVLPFYSKRFTRTVGRITQHCKMAKHQYNSKTEACIPSRSGRMNFKYDNHNG